MSMNENAEGTRLSVCASSYSRRAVLKRALLFGLALPTLPSLLAACSSDEDDGAVAEPTSEAGETQAADTAAATSGTAQATGEAAEAGEGRYGGEFRFALNNDIPTFDLHQASTLDVTTVLSHMYETLFTWDEEFAVIPELAESVEVSEDGLHYTIRLRKGVLFHNGKEMTSKDVVASIDRWANQLKVGYGQELMAATSEWGATDDYTIEFQLSQPFGTLQTVLARQNNACAIYPAEVVETAGASAISEYVGTGPYRFVEHVPDQHIILERFDDYVYRDEPPNGYGGRKFAYFDRIRFIPVPDEAARIAGIQAGEYDQLQTVSPEHFVTLENDPNVVAKLGDPTRSIVVLLNTAGGLLRDVNMRKAVQALVDVDEILAVAFGTDYSRADPGLMMKETVWHSTAGEEYYNMKNPDLAREYLEKAGYNGETIRFLTDQDFMEHYHTSVVLAEQMKDVGMNVELQLFDRATTGQIMADPSAWEMRVTGFSFRCDPTQLPIARTDWGPLWDTPNRNAAYARVFSEHEFEKRYAAWEEVQRVLYEEDVPLCKIGEGFTLIVHSRRVQNVRLYHVGGPVLWNQWFEE